MKILLTGVTGYIGKRLLPVLLEAGHEVICCVRDQKRFDGSRFQGYGITVIEVNLLEKESLKAIPEDIDAAYYLVHSMTASTKDFGTLERLSAENFRERIDQTKARQVIYLSGIVNDEKLSQHLLSRKQVEDILSQGRYKLTTLRAGIIIGSGSASFEIIRDLVEKLPVMITPRWLNTRSQPIAIRNIIEFLKGVLGNENTYGNSYDIGGPEILTYREMLLRLAKVRKLKRSIMVVPVMTPRLSSYWLYFVTSTSYKLAVNLVDSMKVEIICKENNLREMLNISLIPFEEAVRLAFQISDQQGVISSWKDALSGKALEKGLGPLLEVPVYGCFKDERSIAIEEYDNVTERIWSIGGKTGWYYANWLWEIRGFLDQMVGGVGLRRGRRDNHYIAAGDALDFWRVLYANKEEKRLLLFAEMKLPGEAWLEFRIKDGILHQTATFRPLGLWGRIYWYSVLPFHAFIFRGMMKRIGKGH
jgi:uncharacterized protein YbjT (DUF2867 family)